MNDVTIEKEVDENCYGANLSSIFVFRQSYQCSQDTFLLILPVSQALYGMVESGKYWRQKNTFL
jgi:hypothetical protein